MSWFFSSGGVPAPPPKDCPPPALPDRARSASPERAALGTLVVVVLKARHLPTASSSRWTKQSPYACLTLSTAPAARADATSIKSGASPAATALRKLSRDSAGGARARRTSLAGVPPPERAAAVAKAHAKLEKERARTVPQTAPVPAPEDEPLELAPEDELDPRAALCTPPDARGGQHPVWDAELRFPLRAGAARRTLHVEVWAQVGLGRRDRPLGAARLDVEDALAQGTMDVWLPLALDGTARGEVFLNATFFAAPPSQLVPHAASAPAAPAPDVPSALNSLLWRHGIPLRIPRVSLRFLVRKDALPEWVRPPAVLSPAAWRSVVGGFRTIFKWSWAASG